MSVLWMKIYLLWMKMYLLWMKNADLWIKFAAGQDQPGDQPGPARIVGT